VLGIVVMVMTHCDCEDEPAPNAPDNDTTSTVAAQIDSSLWGTWDRYSQSDELLTEDYVRISSDTIVVQDYGAYTGTADTNPTFARTLIAAGGQVYFDPAAAGLPNEYLFDYTHIESDSLLYLVPEWTETATAPMATTDSVIILRRPREPVNPPALAVIDEALIGVWDQYDSSGSTVVVAAALRVTADSIVYLNDLTLKGAADQGGGRGLTLHAHDGQIWKDYHSDLHDDHYVFDYTLSGSSTMYLEGDTSPEATNPGPDTPEAILLKKR